MWLLGNLFQVFHQLVPSVPPSGKGNWSKAFGLEDPKMEISNDFLLHRVVIHKALWISLSTLLSSKANRSECLEKLPYKHTTGIPHWNDAETTVSSSLQRGMQVMCLQALFRNNLTKIPRMTNGVSPNLINISERKCFNFFCKLVLFSVTICILPLFSVFSLGCFCYAKKAA